MPSDVSELKPCPLCLSDHVGVTVHASGKLPDYRVKCWKCGTEGPLRLIDSEAITAWNRRADAGVRDAAIEECAKVMERRATMHAADRLRIRATAGADQRIADACIAAEDEATEGAQAIRARSTGGKG